MRRRESLEPNRPGNGRPLFGFVGRQQEMGELKAALEDAFSGQGRLVMLAGEPGIGKTRTAEELAALARQRGSEVVWGRCREEGGSPPYWPWVQMIRSHVEGCDPESLRTEMGAGASVIAEMVVEVRGRMPDLAPAPIIRDPEQARFRLFDMVTSFFRRASYRRPLVLVLDNLHWADAPTLRLLEFMAHELGESRLLVIGTYRDVEISRGHYLFHTLGDLSRQRSFRRIVLRGLSQEEVRQFVEVMGGIPVPEELAVLVHRQTQGNPLFVGEVTRLLLEEGMLRPGRFVDLDRWGFRVPDGVREAIGRRLDRLSRGCNELLTFASVIGREFGLDLLEHLSADLSGEQVLGALEEALNVGLVEEMSGAMGRYQFSHALVQQALLAELSLNRRVRLHARVAQSLEELYGEQAETHAAELAHHFSEAQAVLGTEKVVHYSLLAGESARCIRLRGGTFVL